MMILETHRIAASSVAVIARPKMLDVIASASCGPARILLNFYEFEIDIHETV
jgi:hypothetical protein